MSRIKELRNDPSNSINVVDILSLFVPDKKTKYIELMLKFLKNTPNVGDHAAQIKSTILEKYPFIKKTDLDELDQFQLIYFYEFINSTFVEQDLKDLYRFCDFNERGLIEQNDLTRYTSFDQIKEQLLSADFKANEKELEKQIHIIYKDDTWLLLRPLTFEASNKYGANTKWCTTNSKGDDTHFKRYAGKGILMYCLNKKNGYKVGIYKSIEGDEEFSFWNQEDKKVESMMTDIPMEVLTEIKKEVKNNFVTNFSLLPLMDQLNMKLGKASIYSGTIGISAGSDLLARWTDSVGSVRSDDEPNQRG